ncbi:hypothetical protein HAX54_040287 [Datura stramonium]|uniref:Uncharacterized protein n=1 Tax=Datura stramonium TaxID=4076 RepID=A0ABS8SK85_DATST|nr:hypothetical protein [Datura stramonium]
MVIIQDQSASVEILACKASKIEALKIERESQAQKKCCNLEKAYNAQIARIQILKDASAGSLDFDNKVSKSQDLVDLVSLSDFEMRGLPLPQKRSFPQLKYSMDLVTKAPGEGKVKTINGAKGESGARDSTQPLSSSAVFRSGFSLVGTIHFTIILGDPPRSLSPGLCSFKS